MSKKLFKVKSKDKTSDSSIVKLDHKTHILKLPDTYIGSIEPTTEYLWNINTHNNQKQKQNNESISDSEIADDSIETTIFTKRDGLSVGTLKLHSVLSSVVFYCVYVAERVCSRA